MSQLKTLELMQAVAAGKVSPESAAILVDVNIPGTVFNKLYGDNQETKE